MSWILVKNSLPQADKTVPVLATIRNKTTGELKTISCVWGPIVDMETGEILKDNSFLNYVGGFNSSGNETCVDYGNSDNYSVIAWMPFPEPYNDNFRVIVAGSRTITNYRVVKENLDKIFSKHWPTSIVCGEARGADMLGRRYAQENRIQVDSYPANWGIYGKQAGYIRNEKMANNADALVAFWDGTSAGTKHMIETAKEKNLQIRVVKVKLL